MNNDGVHDPVNRVCYSFEPRGYDVVVHLRLDPGGGLPAHFHRAIEERWSVVEGDALFRLDGHKRVVRPADGEIVVRPGVVHGLSSTGDHEGHLRCLVTPAPRLQAFLEGSERRGRTRGDVHGARTAARAPRRTLERALPQALPLGNRLRIAPAATAEGPDRAARARREMKRFALASIAPGATAVALLAGSAADLHVLVVI